MDCQGGEDEEGGVAPELDSCSYIRWEFCAETSCKHGFYLCSRERYCISIEQMCDGVNQCPLGDDEYNCGNFQLQGFFKCRNQMKFISHEKMVLYSFINSPISIITEFCGEKEEREQRRKADV
ncbi:DgyrCDS14875 [Dimorphilus gyrociliatus]|uniref:DgyrCDS14875 n=1 Tax=Dimorphilus gyrociliatus TaxID=2664684 RepID=A0A7I8WF67_9ANNE|nr:DgyrCDS14875 [Dimorphilus gyrociliatus]